MLHHKGYKNSCRTDQSLSCLFCPQYCCNPDLNVIRCNTHKIHCIKYAQTVVFRVVLQMFEQNNLEIFELKNQNAESDI